MYFKRSSGCCGPENILSEGGSRAAVLASQVILNRQMMNHHFVLILSTTSQQRWYITILKLHFFMCICAFCWCAHFDYFWKRKTVDSSCIGSCPDNAMSQRDWSLCPFLGMFFHRGGTWTQPNPQEFQPSQYSHSPWPSGLKEAQFKLRSLGWHDAFFRVFHHRMCSLFSPSLQTSAF